QSPARGSSPTISTSPGWTPSPITTFVSGSTESAAAGSGSGGSDGRFGPAGVGVAGTRGASTGDAGSTGSTSAWPEGRQPRITAAASDNPAGGRVVARVGAPRTS